MSIRHSLKLFSRRVSHLRRIAPWTWGRHEHANETDLARLRVLANSMPKCGTHLLSKLIAELTGCTVGLGFLRTGDEMEARRVLEENCQSAGSRCAFLTGHQRYESGVELALRDAGYRVVLILRDPRDVVVSHAHWVISDEHNHAANRRFYRALPDLEHRVMVSICGRPAGWNEGNLSDHEQFLLEYHGVRLDIGTRLRRYLPWIDSQISCVVRFENLVGPLGGGTREAQVEEIRRVANHLDINLSDGEADRIGECLFDSQAATFRKGSIGGWKETFGWHHKLAFKASAGDLLIELGYEQDFDW